MNKLIMTIAMAATSVAVLNSAVALAANSSDQAQQSTPEGANAEMQVRISAKERLSDAFRGFAEELGIEYGAFNRGKFYSKGQSPVPASVQSPDFVKSCSMAYERAFLSAVSQFVMDFYGQETAKKIYNYYNDSSSDINESPVARAKTIAEKVSLLADAKLDKALESEGVPPEKYSGESIVAKRKIFLDEIVNKSIKTAVHASSGCMPVKTFLSIGDDGKYYVGVVVRYDSSSTELARCFKQRRRPGLKKAGGLKLKDALPPKEEMCMNFGVRLYYDDTGYPSLISFGQYGAHFAGKSELAVERAEEQALKQAQVLADSAMTMFINSFVRIGEESEMSEISSDDIAFSEDGNPTPESVLKTIDKFSQKIEQQGTDRLRGRSTVFSEIIKHPSGQKAAVVVRRWSFETFDAVQAIDSKREKEEVKTTDSVEPAKGGVLKGKTFDF